MATNYLSGTHSSPLNMRSDSSSITGHGLPLWCTSPPMLNSANGRRSGNLRTRHSMFRLDISLGNCVSISSKQPLDISDVIESTSSVIVPTVIPASVSESVDDCVLPSPYHGSCSSSRSASFITMSAQGWSTNVTLPIEERPRLQPLLAV